MLYIYLYLFPQKLLVSHLLFSFLLTLGLSVIMKTSQNVIASSRKFRKLKFIAFLPHYCHVKVLEDKDALRSLLKL